MAGCGTVPRRTWSRWRPGNERQGLSPGHEGLNPGRTRGPRGEGSAGSTCQGFVAGHGKVCAAGRPLAAGSKIGFDRGDADPAFVRALRRRGTHPEWQRDWPEEATATGSADRPASRCQIQVPREGSEDEERWSGRSRPLLAFASRGGVFVFDGVIHLPPSLDGCLVPVRKRYV